MARYEAMIGVVKLRRYLLVNLPAVYSTYSCKPIDSSVYRRIHLKRIGFTKLMHNHIHIINIVVSIAGLQLSLGSYRHQSILGMQHFIPVTERFYYNFSQG